MLARVNLLSSWGFGVKTFRIDSTFCTTRGSANIYPCTADGVTASFSAAPTNTINSNAASTATFAGIWTGVQGPFKAIGAVANAAIVEDTGGSGINQANFGDTVDATG